MDKYLKCIMMCADMGPSRSYSIAATSAEVQ